MKQSGICEPHVSVTLFDFAQWFLSRTNRFPKNGRKSLGDRIDASLLELLALVQRASLRRDKRALLDRVNEELHVLRALVRLAVRLDCLQERQYEYAAK
ncbi:MAG TPA: four helix bundle protein [Candidatus Hydrogenedentes bacterium]|nr:four helix bundle protein [Candidatus Hydrogenedentota bacterium]HRT22282.1 four helix bundle protein [Candidatus Hydrogenedentota bacterium]HRT63261.1 four helix bundle protein [Candidatus Hydrogenedentota bacterium]